MASGVKVGDEVKELLTSMKVNRKSDDPSKRIRIVVLHIDGDYVKVEKTFEEQHLADKGNVYKFLEGEMKPNDCRYIVYDCHYDVKDGVKEELVFIMWSDDNAAIKQKMKYASSKSCLKKILECKHEFEFHGKEDVTPRAFAECLSKMAKTGILSLEGLNVSDH
uniref:Cofilin 1 (non-muscle), like n=1 Tax=Neogobius melanostomus TaxID=47308 RepID=A0A8C6SBG3_9GOBI